MRDKVPDSTTHDRSSHSGVQKKEKQKQKLCDTGPKNRRPSMRETTALVIEDVLRVFCLSVVSGTKRVVLRHRQLQDSTSLHSFLYRHSPPSRSLVATPRTRLRRFPLIRHLLSQGLTTDILTETVEVQWCPPEPGVPVRTPVRIPTRHRRTGTTRGTRYDSTHGTRT